MPVIPVCTDPTTNYDNRPTGYRRVTSSCRSETRDTVFHDLRTSEEKFMMALKSLWVPVDLSGICCVLAATKETILDGLRRVAQRAVGIIEHLLRELPVT